MVERVITGFSDLAWGTPLLILLLGGGLFFLLYSRLLPFRYFRHALGILSGKYDNPDEPGHINHYQALSTALAATVGMGNISGVALAIAMGGPGAIFWMWVSALLGVATKYFTCTLAVMYRGKDSAGELQGGPMYVIVEGLGRKWRPLAVFFSVMAMIGVLPMFQVNQLTQIVRDIVLIPNGVHAGFLSSLVNGLLVALLVGLVIFGGIRRIGKVTGRLVPLMVALYVGVVLYIIFSEPGRILPSFALIFQDAFSAQSVLGGAVGALIITGVWNSGEADGITLTANAFESSLPGFGALLLTVCVFVFSLSTMLSFPYYGIKCCSFVFGAGSGPVYRWFYILTIPVGATATLGTVVGIFDGAYALMAFPTMISALLLSGPVMRASKDYFKRLKNQKNAEDQKLGR